MDNLDIFYAILEHAPKETVLKVMCTCKGNASFVRTWQEALFWKKSVTEDFGNWKLRELRFPGSGKKVTKWSECYYALSQLQHIFRETPTSLYKSTVNILPLCESISYNEGDFAYSSALYFCKNHSLKLARDCEKDIARFFSWPKYDLSCLSTVVRKMLFVPNNSIEFTLVKHMDNHICMSYGVNAFYIRRTCIESITENDMVLIDEPCVITYLESDSKHILCNKYVVLPE